MKKTILILVSIAVFHNCEAQSLSSQISTYNAEIIGSWVSDDDSTYKIELTGSGFQKEYINNQVQQEVYHFELTTDCSGSASRGNDINLERYTDSSDITCDIFNGIYTDSNGVKIMSIRTERGKLETYTKQ